MDTGQDYNADAIDRSVYVSRQKCEPPGDAT